MPTTRQLRDLLRLSRNAPSRQVLNRAIREFVPHGGELLDRLEKVDYLRVQFPGRRQIADELAKLRAERDALADAIRDGSIPISRAGDADVP